MRLAKILGVLLALGAVVVLAVVAGPSIAGQVKTTERRLPPIGRLIRGVEIGVSIRDVELDKQSGGVVIADVAAGSPAERAEMKPSDVVVEFDGERVRSARQFSRLVQEAAPGRTVSATVLREGQKKDLRITPTDDRRGDVFLDGERLHDRLGELAARFPGLDVDLDLFGSRSRYQLGVTVQELPPQLAEYFGAKAGVLVSGVTDDSPAARAGLRAGDVITSVNTETVKTRSDLTRSLSRRSNTPGDVTIGIVRDKKESAVKAKVERMRSN